MSKILRILLIQCSNFVQETPPSPAVALAKEGFTRQTNHLNQPNYAKGFGGQSPLYETTCTMSIFLSVQTTNHILAVLKILKKD